MNHKVTTRHLILGLFIDYMLSTGRYSDLIHNKEEINLNRLKEIMVNESEFSIYTPTNVVFTYILLSMLNNQVLMVNSLNSIIRDLESKHWINIISKIVEIRAFEEDNSSRDSGFKIFTVKEVCNLYTQFHPLIQLFIEEDLFHGYADYQKMYPYLRYRSIDLKGREKKLITHFIEDNIGIMYNVFSGESSLKLETYHTKPIRFLYLPFQISNNISESTIRFILYILSFYFVDYPLSKFEYLNENYNV